MNFPLREQAICSIFFFAFTQVPANAQISEHNEQALVSDIKASVIDGDTFRDPRDGQSYRLFGIDACEKDQDAYTSLGQAWPCGAVATTWLASHVVGRAVTCTIIKPDIYGRKLAKCGTEETPDLGAAMVQEGQAVVYRFYGRPTEPAYLPLEAKAQTEHRGIWQGAVQDPAAWRHDHHAHHDQAVE
ncbi:thermonuclease family protein [Beijerinckia indica]|uniref:Nuclease (SNase domain protein) n=1 Tax=Beijerinckia indica subsp. indica (strain ATCC 9039 / DSM 1715 / NCIMB 8712) TaxID=395963 RepID=B2ILH7_BEII9|nr:thermonuclease family protein [Beijerinckia indica]ACB97377.1 nuclease (SNase domain protein) [Beijerinckia indica subsp. indica ATCC 9039]